MPTINKLPLLGTPSSGDQIPVYAPNSGDARRMSITALTDYMQDTLDLPDNSDEVSFLQSGTGAVTRTVQSKLRDVVSVRDFGAVGDGVADDTAAIQAAASSGAAKLVFGGGFNYRTTNTVTFPAGQSLDFEGSRITYAGTRDRPAVIHGSSGQTNSANIQNVWIVSQTLDWSNTAFVGFRGINLNRAKAHARRIEGFTIGWECYSIGQGYTHTTHNLLAIISCKYGQALTCDGTAGLNYVNENTFLGGDITNTSSTDSLGNHYGIWLRAINSGYTNHNSNKWYGPCFQPGNGLAGNERIPIFFDGVGSSNFIHDARYESGRGPAMRLDGPAGDGSSSDTVVAGNIFGCQVFAAAGGAPELIADENGSARLNFALDLSKPQMAMDSYKWTEAHKLVKSASSTATGVLGGLFLTDSSTVPVRSITNTTNLLVLKDSVQLKSTRGIGFFVECEGNDSFSFMVFAKAGYLGRFAIRVYDQNFSALTYDAGLGPDVILGYSARYNYWSAGTFSGSYYATNDGQQADFRVSSRVKYVQFIAVPGGSSALRLMAIGVRRLNQSENPLFVFNNLQDSSLNHYASELPSNGVNGIYGRGDLALRDAAASGGISYYQCTTGGRLAPAWIASTAYVVGDLVKNDTTRIYECVTAGTSASSGGPTGTGSAISDGTASWNYLTTAAVFSNGPSLP